MNIHEIRADFLSHMKALVADQSECWCGEDGCECGCLSSGTALTLDWIADMLVKLGDSADVPSTINSQRAQLLRKEETIEGLQHDLAQQTELRCDAEKNADDWKSEAHRVQAELARLKTKDLRDVLIDRCSKLLDEAAVKPGDMESRIEHLIGTVSNLRLRNQELQTRNADLAAENNRIKRVMNYPNATTVAAVAAIAQDCKASKVEPTGFSCVRCLEGDTAAFRYDFRIVNVEGVPAEPMPWDPT